LAKEPAMGDERVTRARLVSAATDLFIANGFDKTSMREIADKVGFSKPALYHHFASKDDLLLAAVAPLSDALDGLLKEAETSKPTPGQFLEDYFDIAISHKELAAWLSNDSSARSRPILAARGWEQQSKLTQLLRGGDQSFDRGVRVTCALGAVQVGIIVYASTGGLERARDEILRSALLILEGTT
jgi:AcrR family transcriptional regulator